jgi:two-component system, chemotaxis family, chemotaxis protein CheV
MGEGTTNTTNKDTSGFEIIEFTIDYPDKSGQFKKQFFGISVAKILSIIEIPQLTRLPNMHSSIYGVFRLRDSIIPALDLSKNLYGVKNQGTKQKMIITDFNKMKLGLIVNEVKSIHHVKWSDIDPIDSLNDLESQQSSFVGVLKFDDRNLLMLDLEKIIFDIDPSKAIANIASQKRIVDWNPIAVTADDSSTIRKMIGDKLTNAGFVLKSFNDGEQAWNYLQEIATTSENGKKISDLVNIVITDIEMPKLNGYSLTERIKKDPRLGKIPVIIFSSIISPENMQKGINAGADAQLAKPQIGELLETVSGVIKNSLGS